MIESVDHQAFDDVLLTANETLVQYVNSGQLSKGLAWEYMGALGLRQFNYRNEDEDSV